MIEAYLKHEAERKAQGIPPKPLDPEQTRELVKLLVKPPKGKEQFLLDLLVNRVSPGVDPAAEVKAAFLAEIVKGKAHVPAVIDKLKAVELLGTMGGGYNVPPLVAALKVKALAAAAAKALSAHHLRLRRLRRGAGARQGQERRGQEGARVLGRRRVVHRRARACPPPSRSRSSTSTARSTPTTSRRPATPPPAPTSRSTPWPWARPSSPAGLKTIAEYRAAGFEVAFVGDVVGTGSSRKSACNSVLWAIGEDIPFVPNKRRGGVIIGGVIAPIFFNTAAGLRRAAHQGRRLEAQDGRRGRRRHRQGRDPRARRGEVLSTFTLTPETIGDEFRAGGRIPLIIGRALTDRARKALKKAADRPLRRQDQPGPEEGAGLLPGAEDGRPGLRPAGRAARLVRRAEDDHGRLAGHHRPHDGRRAEGAGLPEVPGRPW